MRKLERIPNEGDRRIKKEFLWFPKRLRVRNGEEDYFETRWLETAKWLQTYSRVYYGYCVWTDTDWKD